MASKLTNKQFDRLLSAVESGKTKKGAAMPSSNSKPRPGSRKAKKEKIGRGLSTGAQSAAAAYAVGARVSEPNIKGGYRSTRIVHREFVGNVTGSSSFATPLTLPLNPGMATTFPWLSTQAVGWEQYKFNRLKFSYLSRTGTSTPGSVMLIPDYDAADPAPSTEQIATAYRDVVEEVPWVPEFCCNLDKASMMEPAKRKFIRVGPLSPNLDVKTYDAGTMFVGTVDGTNVAWGKLWVEYDVELFVPQLPAAGDNPIQQITGGTTTANPFFGPAPTVLGTYWINPGNNQFIMNVPGSYYTSVIIRGTSPAFSAPTAGTNCTINAHEEALVGTASAIQRLYFTVTQAGYGPTFNASGTVTSSQAEIVPVSAAQAAAAL